MKLIAFALATISAFTTFAGTFSAGELTAKWNKLPITVCWLDEDSLNRADFAEATLKRLGQTSSFVKATAPLKTKVKEIIQTEYQLLRTGIHFVGWDSCKDTPSYDIQILIVNDKRVSSGTASIGKLKDLNIDYSLVDEHQKGFVRLNIYENSQLKVTAEESLLNTAVHEFGHLAGLRHEHIQTNFSTCSSALLERPKDKTSFFSAYDPSSIMDNCFTSMIENYLGLNFTIKSDDQAGLKRMKKYTDETIFTKTSVSNGSTEYKVKIGLSKGDVHGLRCMYVYDAEEFAQKCHNAFIP